MSFKVGFAGIPVSLKFFTKKSNPEVLKQWQDLDRKKKEQKEEKKLREVRRTQRAEQKKSSRVKSAKRTKK